MRQLEFRKQFKQSVYSCMATKNETKYRFICSKTGNTWYANVKYFDTTRKDWFDAAGYQKHTLNEAKEFCQEWFNS